MQVKLKSRRELSSDNLYIVTSDIMSSMFPQELRRFKNQFCTVLYYDSSTLYLNFLDEELMRINSSLFGRYGYNFGGNGWRILAKANQYKLNPTKLFHKGTNQIIRTVRS